MIFNEYTIEEVCEIVTDYVANGSFKSLAENVKYCDNKDYARLIRLVDYNSNFSENGSVWVTEDSYNFLKKSVLFGGEVIVSNVGANLGTVFICPKLNYPMTLGPNSLLLKTNELCNQEYLYYYLKSFYGYSKLMSLVSGSAMPKFNKTELRKMKISIPNKEIQDKCVTILKVLDNKIELNNEINNNLYELINTIYRDRFSDVTVFKRADEIANVTIGKTPPRSEHECFTNNQSDIKWISISDLGKCGMYIYDTNEKLTEEAVKKYNVKVVPANTVLLSFKLTVGRTAITTCDMTTNEAIAHFNLNDKDYMYYLYSYLNNYDYSKLGSTSSIATAVNSKIIKAMNIGYPEKERIMEYNNIVKPIFEKIKTNEQQNIILSNLRDTLLPRLMNGEIDIDSIEI